MGFRKPTTRNSSEEENPYFISISDLMSGLLVIFILATAVLVLQLTEMKKKAQTEMSDLQSAEKIRVDILTEIKSELNKKAIKVEIDENESVIHIDHNTLSFETDSYELPFETTALATVNTIGDVLYRVITKQDRIKYLNTIFIEGHTDSRPSNKDKMGNWGLSTYRAISVWNHWNKELSLPIPFCEMKNSQGQSLFSVSGYAASRRVVFTDSTEILQRRNRRIDIRITVKNPTVKEYQDVIREAF